MRLFVPYRNRPQLERRVPAWYTFWNAIPNSIETISISDSDFFPFWAPDGAFGGFDDAHPNLIHWQIHRMTKAGRQGRSVFARMKALMVCCGCAFPLGNSLRSLERLELHTEGLLDPGQVDFPRLLYLHLGFSPTLRFTQKMLQSSPNLTSLVCDGKDPMHSVAKWNQSGRPLKLVSLVVSVSACLLLGSSGFEHVERGDACP